MAEQLQSQNPNEIDTLFTSQQTYMKQLNLQVTRKQSDQNKSPSILQQRSSQKSIHDILKQPNYQELVKEDLNKTQSPQISLAYLERYKDYQNFQNPMQLTMPNESIAGYSKMSQPGMLKNKIQPFAFKQFKNGIYYGQENNKGDLHGEGAFYWHEGDFYYGSWNENKLNGLGIFIFAFGGTIEGNFLKGRLEGLNRISLLNGLIYTGFWKQGVQHGAAKIQYPNGKEKTLFFVNGQELLIEQVKNNFIFTQNDMTEQESILKNANGFYFKQILAQNLLYAQEDQGIRLYSPCLGLGISIFPELRTDYGFYFNSQLDGKGRIQFKSGDVYDGYFNNGKFKGSGIYYNHSVQKTSYGNFDGSEIVNIKQQFQGFPPPSLILIMEEIIFNVKQVNQQYINTALIQFILDLKRFQDNLIRLYRNTIFLHMTAHQRNLVEWKQKQQEMKKSEALPMTEEKKYQIQFTPVVLKKEQSDFEDELEEEIKKYKMKQSETKSQKTRKQTSDVKMMKMETFRPFKQENKTNNNSREVSKQRNVHRATSTTPVRQQKTSQVSLIPFQPNEVKYSAEIHVPFAKLDQFQAHFPFGSSPIKHNIIFKDYPQKNSYFDKEIDKRLRTYLNIHGKNILTEQQVDNNTRFQLLSQLNDPDKQASKKILNFGSNEEGVIPLPQSSNKYGAIKNTEGK